MIAIQKQRPRIPQQLVTNVSPTKTDLKLELVIDQQTKTEQQTKLDDAFEKLVFEVFTEPSTKSAGLKDRLQNILMQEKFIKSSFTEMYLKELNLFTNVLFSGLESTTNNEFKKNVSTYLLLEKKLADDPKYRNKYVVIYQDQIVDFGDDKEKLLHDAYSKYGYVSLIVHKVGTKRVIHHLTPFRR